MSDSEQWEQTNLERLYVITGGRSGLLEQAIDLVTLIVARSAPQPSMQPEHAAILRMCRAPVSVAEICAHLSLPVSAVAVLLADLLADNRVEARTPAPAAPLADCAILQAVLDGLHKL